MPQTLTRADGTTRPRPRRSLARFLASAGVAISLVAVPAVLSVPAANAATGGTVTVTAPAEGAVIDPFVPSFSGTGVTTGDTIAITYTNGGGQTSDASRFTGGAVVGSDLSWFTPTNFSDLAAGQTAVSVTVTEKDAAGATVGTPVLRAFSFSSAPNPAHPFTVTSPGSGSTVTTYTPTLTGTANPGEKITVSVSNTDFTTFVAGTATVDANGNFSTVLDLHKVVQAASGTTEVGLNVVRTAADGSAVSDDTRSPLINFTPPVTPVATLTVVEPAEGSTVSPFVPSFSGMGIAAGDEIAITYTNGAGAISSATRFIGNPVVKADLSWFAPTNFSDLAAGQTTVTVTVTELKAGATVGTPVVRTFNFSSPPNPAHPFTVTSPGSGSTVTTYTPTLTGTANPGEKITVSVSNTDFTTFVAGTATVDADGNFSTVLNLNKVVQDASGTTLVGLNVVRTAADGSPVADDERSPAIYFAPTAPPFVPNPPSITVVPDQITVADAMDPKKGVLVTATGFNQNEQVLVTLVAPDGKTIIFTPEELKALGGADATGTFKAPVFLFGQPVLGKYTLTITGVDSKVALTGSFALIANPAVPITPAGNTTPTATTPTATTTSGNLASTGLIAGPWEGLGALLLLVGGALLVLRRRKRSHIAG